MADLRIVDASEIPTENITGEEKLPTGGNGNYSISLDSLADYTKTKKDLADNTSVDGKVNGVRQELDAHIEDLLNPHQVTKGQIGLGNVDNTADADKPVSNSTQAAIISAVAPKADKTYVDNQLTLKANKSDVYTKAETYTKQESNDLVNNSISTALTPVNTALDLAKRGIANRYDSSLTYNSGERVVLTNGDIVKSTVDGNTNDPNVDMGGWVKTNDASQIFDASGKTQQQINEDQEQLNTILNKTGTTESLAESVDATPFLQSLINAMPDGMTLDLLGKTFRVKKNTGFVSDYPNGDQPCLVVKDKKNITITNGKLIVKEHGQGVFDCINSSGELNLEIEGAGTNFPKLDGRTGRGEKGVSDAGYFDQTFYNNGDPRNNSVDTSNYSGGGYGGQFPQWGGGTATTWGTWNGGFIKNFGDGVYIKNSDFLIHRCNIHGFNGYAVVVVEGAVTITQSELHHCYSGGYLTKAYGDGAGKIVSSVHIENNEIYDVGHPDSQVTDFAVDPGYGVSSSNAGQLRTGVERYTVINNTFKRCKRKAIDAHHAYYTNHSNNIIEDCGFGVYVTIYPSGRAPESLHVNDNFIKNTRQCIGDRACGVMVAATNTTNPYTGTVHVCDNTVVDVGMDLTTYNAHKAEYTGGGIGVIVLGVETAIMTGNSVLINPNFVADIGVADNITAALGSPRSVIIGNTVRGHMRYGIFSRHNGGNASNAVLTGASTVVGNLVDITPKVDIPVGESAYAIFVDPDSVVEGNKIVARSGVKKYYNPNIKGEYVTFRYNLATKALSIVTQSGDKVAIEFDNIQVTVLNNTVKFQIAASPFNGIDSVTITELAVPQTASYFGVSYFVSEQVWNAVTLSFYSLNNGVKTDVPLSSLNGGILQIKLFLS